MTRVRPGAEAEVVLLSLFCCGEGVIAFHLG